MNDIADLFIRNQAMSYSHRRPNVSSSRFIENSEIQPDDNRGLRLSRKDTACSPTVQRLAKHDPCLAVSPNEALPTKAFPSRRNNKLSEASKKRYVMVLYDGAVENIAKNTQRDLGRSC